MLALLHRYVIVISMMSRVMFEKLEMVLRIRNENQVFGGIQVIGVGDFLELLSFKTQDTNTWESMRLKVNFSSNIVCF